MPKAGKRARESSETYDSDGGFVSNDDGNAPKKKSKKGQAAAKSNAGDGAEKFWELSSGRNPRRVAISTFKGTTLINLREYYEKDDEYLPGKKGISLTVEQYQAFLKFAPEINASLQKQGIDVSGEANGNEDAMEDEEGVTTKKKRVKAKKEIKANIEATSDEDED